jgi:hypothetical protein
VCGLNRDVKGTDRSLVSKPEGNEERRMKKEE